MKVYNSPVAATPVALNANYTGSAFQIYEMFGYAVQLVITGTPTGTFTLQGSCDPASRGPAGDPPPTHWSNLADTDIAVSAAGTVIWNLANTMYNWARITYADGSSGASTATFTGTFNGKGA